MPCVMAVEAVEAEGVYVISNHSAVDSHVMHAAVAFFFSS